jgi:hypothetical protein
MEGAAVEQDRRSVVGVQVGEQRHGRVRLGQGLVEPAAAKSDEAVELVDQGLQIPPVAEGCRFRRGDGGRFAALQAVDLELGEGPGDEQPGSGMEPFRVGLGMLRKQGEAAVNQPRPARGMPGGVSGLRVDAQLFDPREEVVTWWRGPSCRRELRSGRALALPR